MRLNVSEIARALGVERTTIRRGLDALCVAGICEKCDGRYELRVSVFDTLEPVEKVERDATPAIDPDPEGVDRDATGGCSTTLQKVERDAPPFKKEEIEERAREPRRRKPPSDIAASIEDLQRRAGPARRRGHEPSVFS